MQEIAFSGRLATPEQIRELQRRLYRKAKQDTAYRVYSLYDTVYRADILRHAYAVVRANKGAPGMDGVTFAAIEREEGGVEQFLSGLAEELRTKQDSTSSSATGVHPERAWHVSSTRHSPHPRSSGPSGGDGAAGTDC